MIVFDIVGLNKSFEIPEAWHELTLKDYISFVDAVSELQKKLKEDEKEESGLYEIIILYRKEFNDIFQAFTKCEGAIIEKIKAKDLNTLYLYMLEFMKEPKEKRIESFKFKRRKYYLPKSKYNYFGNEMPMAEATFGEVVEAMQVQELDKAFNENNFKALPYQIAILCKPKDEEYDDQKVRERAKLFEDLTMDIVWQINFFLLTQKISLINNFPQFLKETQNKLQISQG